MKVYGYEVPSEVEAACLDRMKEKEFRASDIADAAYFMAEELRKGISGGLPLRIADRLIQRERLAKNIKATVKYPYWVWCGK